MLILLIDPVANGSTDVTEIADCVPPNVNTFVGIADDTTGTVKLGCGSLSASGFASCANPTAGG